MTEVLIAIPTFRRPKGLARLLRALEELDTRAEVSVVVADNDAQSREGMALVAELERYRWPVEAILVPERGIAQVRNALVEHALSRSQASFIAMLDDDDYPSPSWLDVFLREARISGADALHGAVVPEFEIEPGPWARHCQGLMALHRRTGPVAMIHGTSNVLLRREILARMPKPCFDPAFALTGGEDKDFFARLKHLGARFAWADAAVVHSYVPASRSRPQWALQRAYRIGNSDMRVFLKYEPGLLARAREAAKIAGVFFLAPALALVCAPLPAWRLAPFCRLWRAAGKLAAVFGSHYTEYAVVHGG